MKFETTCWKTVFNATGDSADSKEAFSTLFTSYWPPLYAFALRLGNSPESSKDLTQGFFLSTIENRTFARAEMERGQFRTFIITAFRNFISNKHTHDSALKRGGGAAHLALETVDLSRYNAPAILGSLTPDQIFERQWALQVLELARARLRNAYDARGNLDTYLALEPLLSSSTEKCAIHEIAEQLRQESETIRVALHRLRRRYRSAIRQEIGNTVANDDLIDEEIQHLFSALGAPFTRAQ